MKTVCLALIIATPACLLACSGGAAQMIHGTDGGQDGAVGTEMDGGGSHDAASTPDDAGPHSDASHGLPDMGSDSGALSDTGSDSSALPHVGRDGGDDAGSNEGGPVAALPCPTLYVDAKHGADTNDGASQTTALKSITHAFNVSSSCTSTIQVAAGTYDTSNGEVFPLYVPAGVALVGDEPNKGNAPGAQVLVGEKNASSYALFEPNPNSTVAGFAISSGGAEDGVDVDSPGITVKDNTLLGNDPQHIHNRVGVSISGSVTGVVVVGNYATDWGYGYAIDATNQNTASFESNVSIENFIGIQVVAAGVDLGGGPFFHSPGKNTFACSTSGIDLSAWDFAVYADDDVWSQSPPAPVIQTRNGAVVLSTGATAVQACPP